MKQGLLLVDHGSRITESNELLVSLAERIRLRHPGLIVEIAHMELANPTIAEGYARCVRNGAETIVVHPYMLVPGRHATRDVPNLVKQAAESYPHIPFKVTAPLGLHEKICDVVLERAGIS